MHPKEFYIKMKNRRWTTFALLFVFFVGLSVMLYPALSDYWNSRTQSKAIVDYESLLNNLDTEIYNQTFEKAEEYNRALAALDYPLVSYSTIPNYGDILNLSGNGMMGFITIDKIGVELPLYHGTSDAVLSIAAGHVEGTSLPTGGIGTHSVISAHRGLPTARLFTDLDRMEIGDVFTITVLDRVLTYQVDQIRIVQPNDLRYLEIDQNEDFCTLLTCTPYGINTERLLVRGRRIETIEKRTIHITNDGYQIDTLIVTPVVALPILFVLMLIVLLKPIKKPNGGV